MPDTPVLFLKISRYLQRSLRSGLLDRPAPGPSRGPALIEVGLCWIAVWLYAAPPTVMSSLRMKITVTTATMLRWVTSVGLTLPSSSGV